MKTFKRIIPVTIAFLSLPAFAADRGLDSGGGYNLAYFLFICLVVIIVAYYATRWIAKYAKGAGNSHGRLIKIAESVYLGPNRGLHLILVGKKLYLIGQADLGLSILAEIEDEELIAQAVEHAGETGGTASMNSFGQYLQTFMARDAKHPFLSMASADQLKAHLDRIRSRKDRGE
ncbi:MAG TPA: flagellar biosynthetic protein FliO [Bacillota bacterium]|nr:flagellar biosynthetic protein FliO [Bacillota bacterium]